jgi:hypothetical protein
VKAGKERSLLKAGRHRGMLGSPTAGARLRKNGAREEGDGDGERQGLWMVVGHQRASAPGDGASFRPIAKLGRNGGAPKTGSQGVEGEVEKTKSTRVSMPLVEGGDVKSASPLGEVGLPDRKSLRLSARVPLPVGATRWLRWLGSQRWRGPHPPLELGSISRWEWGRGDGHAAEGPC